MTALLDRTVGFLADKLDRRGFMGKAAVVGSAVVAAPLEFALRPRTAYAAVCNCNGSSCQCGSLCCDGYTEFCCTLNGRNTCPPGTITAGWWKVDGSQFCGGAARYYLDCNAQCGTCGCGANGVCAGSCSGTGCGCAGGSCNNRKAGCTRFRYGQCNQGVRCVGPIVCRVVTCQPPWQFDPACGTSSRTDNATRNHDRPCLNEPFGNLDSAREVPTGARLTGWGVSHLDYGIVGIRIWHNGRQVREVTANIARPDVQRAYPAFGTQTGFDTTLPLGPGRHDLCAYAVDRRNGRQTLIGFKQVDIVGPRGRIDSITDAGAGRIRIVGWAVDPLAGRNPGTFVLRVDDREVARGTTSRARPDVAAQYPNATGLAGFDVTVPAAPGTRRVCLNVLQQGRSVQVQCRTAAVARPRGAIDSITDLRDGRIRIVGWALDPSVAPNAGTFVLRVDDREVARGATTRSRPDVQAAYPGQTGTAGFDVTVAAAPGQRRVCLNVIQAGSSIQLLCRGASVAGG